MIQPLRYGVFGLFLAAAAVAPSAQAGLIHSYDLTSSFNDQLGGPTLTNNGPLSPSGYSFTAGAANLTLSNALPDPTNYTIEMNFKLNTAASGQTWSDILNFHNSDQELYDYCGGSPDHGATIPCTLQLYPGTGAGGILSGVFTDLVFARNGATNTVDAWLNGVQILSGLGDSGRAIFSDTNNIIRFFYDDNGAGENSGGTVTTIRIYDQPYTPSTLPLPEPATATLLAGSLLALCWRGRRLF